MKKLKKKHYLKFPKPGDKIKFVEYIMGRKLKGKVVSNPFKDEETGEITIKVDHTNLAGEETRLDVFWEPKKKRWKLGDGQASEVLTFIPKTRSKKDKKEPINHEYTLAVGGVYLYKNKPVYITSGKYRENGRISNCWSWRPILKDGSLGKEKSGYGNNGHFSKFNGEFNIKIILS